MSTAGYAAVSIAIGFLVGAVLSLIYRASLTARRKSIENEGQKYIEESKKAASSIKREADLESKDLIYQAKTEAEKELRDRRNEQSQVEKRLRQKEENLDRKTDQLEKRDSELGRREKEVGNKEKSLQSKEAKLDETLKEQTSVLERISGVSTEDAKRELFHRVEEEAVFESAKLAKRIEDEARDVATKKAQMLIGLAVQRYASDYISDATITAVSLPGDDMKGRIIGREGRNIRALEAATGVDLIVDDTPEVVTLSAFDPVRREVARLSLERLIADGRIHPARIEEVVEKARKEVDAIILEEGEKAVFDLGLSGIHPDVVKLIGRLKYRTSYGQNVLQHSREVAYLAGMMAGELGGDANLAKRAGLLHDIGKGVDHEYEGSHQDIGSKLAKKYGEKEKVINAILVHHGEGEPATVEAALVAAADALSAARPGVRSESIENYIKRLEKLEEIAMAQKGVEKCYAIQAGREVRIIVKPEELTDEAAYTVAKDIAKAIETEMSYPGQIKVTVIRESRYVEYAK